MEDDTRHHRTTQPWITPWERNLFHLISIIWFPVSSSSSACSLAALSQSLPNKTAAAAKSLQSRLTLYDPIDGSPPGSTVPGILQARTLEWVVISFSNAWKWKVKVKSFSCVRLFMTPWTAAYQAPPSMGFSRQEYCSGLTLPFRDLHPSTSEIPLSVPRILHPQFH